VEFKPHRIFGEREVLAGLAVSSKQEGSSLGFGTACRDVVF